MPAPVTRGEPVAKKQPGRPKTLQRKEDLLEVRLRQAGSVGDITHRGRALVVAVQGKRQQRATRIVTACRNLHGQMLPGVPPAGGCFGPARGVHQVAGCRSGCCRRLLLGRALGR